MGAAHLSWRRGCWGVLHPPSGQVRVPDLWSLPERREFRGGRAKHVWAELVEGERREQRLDVRSPTHNTSTSKEDCDPCVFISNRPESDLAAIIETRLWFELKHVQTTQLSAHTYLIDAALLSFWSYFRGLSISVALDFSSLICIKGSLWPLTRSDICLRRHVPSRCALKWAPDSKTSQAILFSSH